MPGSKRYVPAPYGVHSSGEIVFQGRFLFDLTGEWRCGELQLHVTVRNRRELGWVTLWPDYDVYRILKRRAHVLFVRHRSLGLPTEPAPTHLVYINEFRLKRV